MRKALLIGFQYSGEKKLPGIATDLYQVYSFLKKHDWQDDEICVMTDIEKDESTDILKVPILEKIVDSDILTFVEECKNRNQYIRFTSHNHYNNFSSIFPKTKNLFIYYTGHYKDGIILPNMSLVDLTDYLLSERIFCIMDCCNAVLNLPFVLDETIFRCREELKFYKQKIICISSSSEDEKSITTPSGSLFTRHLFSFLLKNDSSKLSSILKKMGKIGKQKGNIEVTHPILCYIPPFFFSYPNLDISIYNSHIVVNKLVE